MNQNEPQFSKEKSLSKLTIRIKNFIENLVSQLGYELVHIEIQTQRQKALKIFIDRVPHSQPSPSEPLNEPIGLEDCVKISRALDQPLDTLAEIEEVFHGKYDLEVSSPGVDRPLTKPGDFVRFQGQEARISVFRPLNGEEIENLNYLQKKPKAKEFFRYSARPKTRKGSPGDCILSYKKRKKK